MTRIVNSITALILTAALFLIAKTTPAVEGIGTHRQIFDLPCLFNHIFKIPCPSCGMTTSISFLLHGQLIESFRAHLFGPLIFISIIIVLAASIYGAIKNWPWWNLLEKRWLQNLIICAIILYIVVWVIKMIIRS